MLEVVREFILKLMTPDGLSTGTIPQRVSRLNHELWNDTVEDDALEVAAARMPDEVLDGLGRLLRE